MESEERAWAIIGPVCKEGTDFYVRWNRELCVDLMRRTFVEQPAEVKPEQWARLVCCSVAMERSGLGPGSPLPAALVVDDSDARRILFPDIAGLEVEMAAILFGLPCDSDSLRYPGTTECSDTPRQLAEPFRNLLDSLGNRCYEANLCEDPYVRVQVDPLRRILDQCTPLVSRSPAYTLSVLAWSQGGERSVCHFPLAVRKALRSVRREDPLLEAFCAFVHVEFFADWYDCSSGPARDALSGSSDVWRDYVCPRIGLCIADRDRLGRFLAAAGCFLRNGCAEDIDGLVDLSPFWDTMLYDGRSPTPPPPTEFDEHDLITVTGKARLIGKAIMNGVLAEAPSCFSVPYIF